MSELAARVGAVVVNYDGDGGEALLACVASLRAAGLERIVVVDSASRDGSLVHLAEADRDVELVPTGSNRGYGTAANRGVERLSTPYVVISNLDLVVDPDAVALLLEAIESEDDVAMVGPAIRGSDGSRYPSARAFPSFTDALGHALLSLFWPDNPWSRRYRRDDADPAVSARVDWLSGAFMLVREDAFSSIGGFDEGYFMYVEDLDLCWRLRRAGWATRYVPAAEVVHAGGVSTRRHPYKMLIEHHRSTVRFAWRSQSGVRRALVPAGVIVLTLRCAAALADELARSLGVSRGRVRPTSK